MKKIYSLAFILITFLSFSQNEQTTEKIYNYITKGYKIQLDSGLDIGLKGYKIVDYIGANNLFKSIIRIDGKNIIRSNEFKLIFKEGDKYPCAIMMITHRLDNNVIGYNCIPSYNSEKIFWDKFREDLFSSLLGLKSINSYEQEVASSGYSYYYNSLTFLSNLLTTQNNFVEIK